jgi:hypothetical protein
MSRIFRLDILIFRNEIFDKDYLNYLLNPETDTTNFPVNFLPIRLSNIYPITFKS